MYLKKGTLNGKIYLSIAHNYRNAETKKVNAKIIRSLGYLEDLAKEYTDPIAHFKQVIAEMNEKEKNQKQQYTVNIDPNAMIEADMRKNIGYAPLSSIYHNLGLHTFLNNKARYTEFKFPLNDIMKTEVFSRILFPNSKKSTWENKHLFFEKNDYSLHDVYRSLTYLNKIKNDIQNHVHNKMVEKYGRTNELMYYDVTNYYFEIDEQDELRRKGVSKEHRPDPIVQMGLFMDSKGIPVTYRLFPGNTNDCETMIPFMRDIKREYEIEKTIIVADKGLNTSGNIAFNILAGDGYVYSQTVRGGHKELKDYVLDNSEYRNFGKQSKIKSRIYPREINVTDIRGKKKKVRIDEKQVVFYSEDYDKRAKAEREPALQKARDLVNNPSRYNRATSYGAAKYVKNLEFDPKTGEVKTTKSALLFDEEKIREEEKWDGYYAIVTSELEKTDEEIIEIYKGLWKIEESFKVTKSCLDARPVHVTRADHIQAHFLICFVALVIIRLLENQLNNNFSAQNLADSLSNASGYFLTENLYHFGYTDDVLKEIEKSTGIPLCKKYLTLGEIKNIFANTKK